MPEKIKQKAPPTLNLNPYVFTVLLFLFGLWCTYDGWLTTDPGMQEHQLFNRVLGFILIPWSAYDFFKVKRAKKRAQQEKQD